VDLFWLINPVFSPAAFAVHWLDVATLAGVGGLWLAMFVQQLKGRPLVPLGDPALADRISA
jgi:hypothetical protein